MQDYESSEEEYDCNHLRTYETESEDEYQIYEFDDRKTTFKNPPRKNTNRVTRSQSESRKEREMLMNKNRKIQGEEMETDDDSDMEVQDRKITRSEALQRAQKAREAKFRCRNCENIGHFSANCPTLSMKERERILKTREKNKERKKKDFSIDLEKRFKESPCGLTIEEAMKLVPGYKKKFSKIFKVIKKEKR